jgi:membrane-associated phospholipid phosphatase
MSGAEPTPSRGYLGPLRSDEANFRMASLLWMAGITMLLVPMTTLIDIPIARWFANEESVNREVGDTLELARIYAHGSGVFLILLGIGLLAPKLRWHLPRLATLAMGGGAVATLLKMFVLRPRPNSFNLDAGHFDYAWIWSFDWSLSKIATFDAATRAFPSADVATATALTFGLCVVVPRGRIIFIALCVGTMLQRLYCNAHFLSDLCGSAAIGLAWAYVCYHPSLMGSIFDKMEVDNQRTRRRQSTPETEQPRASEVAEHPSQQKAA